ncbi:AI-2E family transporter [Bacillus andreraoultii]|uniref:AI-2E family transporter n=1 Tax=Bacillus andreraoultii TaxID=1499685 RepID=UPI000539CA07|nr:AI-2E family transporter [Bacillus andreraoultii]
MDIKVKWFYRLGFLLLLFVVLFIFIKLAPMWEPVVQIFITVLLPFIIAGFIAYLLYPLVDKLHKNGLQRWLSVFLVYVLFFGGIGYAVYKGIPIFIKQLKDLSENVPMLIDQYEMWANYIEKKTKTWPLGIHEQIDAGFDKINDGIERFIDRVLNFFLWLFDRFFLLLLIPFIAFYFLKDIAYIKSTFWSFIPRKWRKQTSIFLENVEQSLGNYIRGQLIVCATVGIIASIFFWIIKIDYPLLLGSIIGITNVIPYFGPFIGIVPAAIIASQISIKMVIFVVLFLFCLQFVEGNILSPYIVGKSLRMHPLLIMFSILIGGEIGGVIGLIFAVPIVAIIKTTFMQAFEQFRNRNTV